jgi:ABC-2 type transport system ATP-binding protein
MGFVKTENLSKRFGEFQALRDCTVSVAEGEVFGLLGPNGAGKTTWIRLLLGFLRPSGGTASVGGVDCVSDSVGVRRQVSYLPADACLPRHMRGDRLIDFFAKMHPQGNRQRSLEVAARLELDLSRRVAFMSTGMRQKLALAVVMGPATPLLILDEPTANLDPSVRSEVLRLVQEAKHEGRTIIFSSHVLSEIEDVCDRAVFLRRGQLVLSQPLAELRDRYWIRGLCSSTISDIPKDLITAIDLQQLDGRFSLDASGELAPIMRWLLTHPVTQLKVEPVRLKTVYDRVHHCGEYADDSLEAVSQLTKNGVAS